MTVAIVPGRPGNARRMSIKSTVAAILAVTSQLALAPAARADALPARLLAAARSIPTDATVRRVCLSINGLRNALSLPLVLGDQRVSAGSPAYTAATVGAYLGDGPTGARAPPFVQALLDAGAAIRLPVTWTQRTHVPAPPVSALQDLGTARPAATTMPGPAFVDRETTSGGDIYLVTGHDRDLFARDVGLFPVWPPSIADAAGTDPARQGPGSGAPPPGVWATRQVCYSPLADRVLEYGDVVDHGNGVSEVTALILFRSQRVPAWITDQRVIQTLRPSMRPFEVRAIVFRNDGDGWRAEPVGWPRLEGKTHILEDAE